MLNIKGKSHLWARCDKHGWLWKRTGRQGPWMRCWVLVKGSLLLVFPDEKVNLPPVKVPAAFRASRQSQAAHPRSRLFSRFLSSTGTRASGRVQTASRKWFERRHLGRVRDQKQAIQQGYDSEAASLGHRQRSRRDATIAVMRARSGRGQKLALSASLVCRGD